LTEVLYDLPLWTRIRVQCSPALLTLLLLSPKVQARWLNVEEAGSVVENYAIEYEVAKNGSWTQTNDYTLRIQGEDAKVNDSLFPIEYNSASETVEVLEAYTLNGKEKIPVDPANIEDRDKGEAKDYDAMKVRSVVFPQVQMGSKLHIRFAIHTVKPPMENRWSDQLTLSPGQMVEKLEVTVHSELPLFFKVSDPQKLVRVRQADKFNIKITNLRPIPGWVQAEKDPYFHPGGFSYVWMTSELNWPEFMQSVAADFSAVQAEPLPKALHPWVAQAKKLRDPELQILNLMERMSREFRYFGDWRRLNGGIVPRKLSEIEKSRYGDCKDLASLLAAMLRALGIDANVALVRRGENPWVEEPDYDTPNMDRFNHAIVRARVNGQTLWLDATNPVASLHPIPDIAGRPAWVLLQTQPGYFDRLPPSESKNFVHQHEYEYRFKDLDTVTVSVNAQLKGMAAYHLANELLLEPRSEVLSESLVYFSEEQEVRNFHFAKEPDTSRVLSDMNVKLDYEASKVTYDAGKAAFFVIPDGFLSGPFYETEARESDLRLGDEPFLFLGTRRLKDTRLAQKAPQPCKIQSTWMDLERTISVDGPDVLITQNVNLKRPFVTHSEYRSKDFRNLQQEAKRCFYRSGILIESLNGAL
jgi:hypothetical protein